MHSSIEKDLSKAQDLAKTAHVFAILALIFVGLAILSNTGLPMLRVISTQGLTWTERINESGLLLVQTLPAILLCLSINQLIKALQEYSEGEFFSHQASTHVARSGDYAVQAMVAAMLIVPNLSLWISHNGGFDIRIENEFIGMLAFAIFIATVGRILTAAATLKQENESFI